MATSTGTRETIVRRLARDMIQITRDIQKSSHEITIWPEKAEVVKNGETFICEGGCANVYLTTENFDNIFGYIPKRGSHITVKVKLIPDDILSRREVANRY